MFLFEKTHRYLKNDYQFFDALKTKDRKIRGNCNLLIQVKFHELEWSFPFNFFPTENCMRTLESLFFLMKMIVKFRTYRLAKFLTLIETELLQFFSRLCTYLWDIHGLKNHSAASRSGYFYGVNQTFCLTMFSFSKLKVIFWNIYKKK